MGMKMCLGCKKEKSVIEFSKNRSKKDGRATTCLECGRKYNKTHYTKHKSYFYERSKRRMSEARKVIDEIKKTGCCQDCGLKDFEVLEFDHIKGTKKFNIAIARSGNIAIKKLKEELKKCELVCANCHRKRTRRRERKKLLVE